MGLFDIFRKKKQAATENQEDGHSLTNQDASAVDESDTSRTSVAISQSRTADLDTDSQSRMTQPLNEKIDLVTESEAAIWQDALQTKNSTSQTQSQPGSNSESVSVSEYVNSQVMSTDHSQLTSQSLNDQTSLSISALVDSQVRSTDNSQVTSQSNSNSLSGSESSLQLELVQGDSQAANHERQSLSDSTSQETSKSTSQEASKHTSQETSQQSSERLASTSTADSLSASLNQSRVPKSPVTDDNQAVYDRGLKKSRSGFAERFNRFLANFRSVDENFFEELEETLIGADVGFELAIRLTDELRQEVKLQNAKSKDDVQQVIIQKMVDLYDQDGQAEDNSMHYAPTGETTVILMVGVNGVGKTTTIGKMADRYRQEGNSVLLAAADTFRAGATKQLQEWGVRSQVPVVAGKEKADPASVVFEAVKKAQTDHYDILLVDTAGRLQNNVNLMQELAKMKRIIQREMPDAPQEVLLVLDATTGQNALQQAKLFKNSSDVTGIVLTKVDGTAKGGIVFAIRSQMHLPVKWIGFGEKASDLRLFDPEEFIYGMFKDLVKV